MSTSKKLAECIIFTTVFGRYYLIPKVFGLNQKDNYASKNVLD